MSKVYVVLLICLSMLWLPVPQQADTPLGIAQALPCGKDGETEGVSPGNDLYTIKVDLSRYPNAVCNDGTASAFFVRRYTKKADRNRWVIFLLGGGACISGKTCAERWCSINSNYGADKMSTSLLKGVGIRGSGIFSTSTENRFSSWNQVFIYYCSSDTWIGSASNTELTVTDNTGREISYSIHFRGSDIIDGVLGMLKRESGQPVKYKDSSGKNRSLPDLDEAEIVLFAGSSAGGSGVKYNVDRVGELLKKTNRNCQKPEDCSFSYLGVIDASYPPSLEKYDLSGASFCKEEPFICTYEQFYMDRWKQVFQELYKARIDQSCIDWHQKNLPGTEWRCADSEHVVSNHITTPLFIRMDLQDQTGLRNVLETGLTTPTQFGQLVREQLLALSELDRLAEEGSVRSGGSKLRTPGIYGPQCTHHYGLSVSVPFFNVRIPEVKENYHDLLWNWVQGQQPNVVREFTAAGSAAECPREN